MKARKFKIRLLGLGENAYDVFKRETVRDWKLASKNRLPPSEFDLELVLQDISSLAKIFSPERIRLIQAVKEMKPESIYQLSKLLGRLHTNVHKDVRELANMGILELKELKQTKGHRRKSLRKSLHPVFKWDGFDIAV